MGFRARFGRYPEDQRRSSAEDVYRYVFRLDQTNRSLTDGFSLSIVFVNDNSSTCRDFIRLYFVDLCYRTADRIRIIFFSELESYLEAGSPGSDEFYADLLNRFLEALHFQNYREIDRLLSIISSSFEARYVDALYQIVHEERYGNTRDVEGRIRALFLRLQEVERASRRENRFRRIYDGRWRDLTPKSMIPIDSPEQAYELSFNTRRNMAVPGFRESMHFAANLGIGRHTPCFVFFTDIGELSIDIFPISGLSADGIYERLRNWIDKFYEENRSLINKWNQVEQNIVSFTKSVNRTLTELQTWIQKGDALWKDLGSTAIVIAQLISSLSKPETYSSVVNGLNITSSECKQILSQYQATLKNISNEANRHNLKQAKVGTIIQKIDRALTFNEVYDALQLANSERNLFFTETGYPIQLINEAIDKLSSLNLPDPKAELLTWWKSIERDFLSFKRFHLVRKNWAFITNTAYQASQSEFERLIDVIFSLPCSDTPEVMLAKVRESLAGIVGIDAQSSDWDIAFSKYSGKLDCFFNRLCKTLPKWIAQGKYTLKIADIIPFRDRNVLNYEEKIAGISPKHPLHLLINQAEIDWLNQNKDLSIEREKIALQYRSELLPIFIKLQKPFDPSERGKSTCLQCINDIRCLRDRLEKQLIDLANSSSNYNDSLIAIDTHDVERFSRLLDEYDSTIKNLIYPHKYSSEVQSLELPSSVSQVLSLKTSGQVSQSDIRRRDLKSVIHNSETSAKLLQDIRDRSQTLSPVAWLAKELGKSICNNGTFSDSVEQRNILSGSLEDKLYELSDDDLENVWNSIFQSRTAKSKEEIVNTILAILGLIPSREKMQLLACQSPQANIHEFSVHQQLNSYLLEIIRLQASQPIHVEATAVVSNQSDSNTFNNDLREAKVGSFANQVNDNARQQTNQYNYASVEKQTLAEAADEIQRLLKQLEETNPTATEPEQIAYVNVATKPDLKQRAIAALKAGGDTAIDEFFLENKYLKVGKAVIKAWLQPSS